MTGETLTVLLCYATTEDTDSAAKDLFYDSLDAVVYHVPRCHRLIVLGDFNANVFSEPQRGPSWVGMA
jgi:hypothetical protein